MRICNKCKENVYSVLSTNIKDYGDDLVFYKFPVYKKGLNFL